ncbi:MAG: addiction module toxin, HicA family [Deltaproteobacteria bacterium]|nr:addiction module toxin, HicA family [Deltaproteobacteria bacterium]
MKRRDLLQHLTRHRCELLREGSRHSWWRNVVTGRRSAVPRHSEISNQLARKVCRDLGVPEPERF